MHSAFYVNEIFVATVLKKFQCGGYCFGGYKVSNLCRTLGYLLLKYSISLIIYVVWLSSFPWSWLPHRKISPKLLIVKTDFHSVTLFQIMSALMTSILPWQCGHLLVNFIYWLGMDLIKVVIPILWGCCVCLVTSSEYCLVMAGFCRVTLKCPLICLSMGL